MFQPPTRSKNCRKSGFFRDLRLYVTEYVIIKFVAVLKGSTPFTRSTYFAILNSNLANEALLKLPLECAFVCNSVCNFLCKKPLPSAKRENGKIFHFFFEQRGILSVKAPHRIAGTSTPSEFANFNAREFASASLPFAAMKTFTVFIVVTPRRR